MIHDWEEETAYTRVMGHMDVVSIVSDAFKTVDILDRDLLEEQHNAMAIYLAVLDRRIERFAPQSN